jgi:hypothetical protein
MENRRTRWSVVFAAVLLAGASHATTLLELGFSDLARQADRIVIGTVTRIEGRWDASQRFIHSDVTLSVERSLRGDAPPAIVLRTLGGYVGGTGQMAHGAATFEIGERVLVFLTTWEDGTPKVLGYVQGKSRVVSDEQGRERLQGGSADGRSLEGVIRELRDGPDHNIPLRPAS